MANYTGVAKAGGGFNPFAAGTKTYGGGRKTPNLGATSNRLGYAKRDAKLKARNNALLQFGQKRLGIK